MEITMQIITVVRKPKEKILAIDSYIVFEPGLLT